MPTPVKFHQLKDLNWVVAQLQIKSMQTLAEEVGCPASSVRWVVERYFTPEQREAIKYERKPHKNKKRLADIPKGTINSTGVN